MQGVELGFYTQYNVANSAFQQGPLHVLRPTGQYSGRDGDIQAYRM